MDGIINNHVFDDGNKRTAFTAGVALVEYLTGRDVVSTVQEEVQVTLAVEQGHMSIADLAEWLEAHSAPCS